MKPRDKVYLPGFPNHSPAMNKVLSLFAALALCGALYASELQPYCADMNYSDSITTCSYTFMEYADRRLKMEIDLPKEGSTPYPFVFYVTGGSWKSGSVDAFRRQSAYMASQGVAGVRIEYSLIEHGADFRMGLQELQAAYDFVAARARELGLDTLRFGYVAASAGTPLAANKAMMMPGCRFFVGCNGVYDLTDQIEPTKFPEKDTPYLAPYSQEQLRELSPVNNIPDNSPAIAVFHGKADKTISSRQSVLFCEKVRQKGGRAEIFLYDDARHGFFNYGMSNHHENVTRKIYSFIVSVLDE